MTIGNWICIPWVREGGDPRAVCSAGVLTGDAVGQKHFTQRRKVVKGAKQTQMLFFASLCALASLCEIVYFFTDDMSLRLATKDENAPGDSPP